MNRRQELFGDIETRGVLETIETSAARAVRRRLSARQRQDSFVGANQPHGAGNAAGEAGKLPTIARLIEGGSSGNLRSEEPANSSTLNTTLATGRRPVDHGIQRMLEFHIPGLELIPAISNERDYGGPVDTFFFFFGIAGLLFLLVQ